ncbi:hypothetical protein HDF15_004402 [Granulicella mallensis]|uniref:Uncharacterized protein n=1 Tax=Granulicella mallensis TaxID=940614 RepID=A0A7W8EBP5_9BACT|nr:hypothetical protein [Granulicella mallensis]
MVDRALIARRINNGQSELWFGGNAEQRLVLATNNIVYSIRMHCTTGESEAFHAAFATGEAAVPPAVVSELAAEFGL